nr:hypothetical protein Iba_chr06bCG6820 [Ipomoea batatas]
MTVKVSSFQTLWGNALEYLSELAFEALHICFQRIHGPPQQTNWSHSVFLKSKDNGLRIGGSTSMPILAAVPAIILMADSMVVQLRNDITGFISSPGIVVLTESHNVDTLRTQCRPNRWSRRRLPCLQSQLYHPSLGGAMAKIVRGLGEEVGETCLLRLRRNCREMPGFEDKLNEDRKDESFLSFPRTWRPVDDKEAAITAGTRDPLLQHLQNLARRRSG